MQFTSPDSKARLPGPYPFTAGDAGSPTFSQGVLADVLRNPRRLARPVPLKGQLGLFNVPDDIPSPDLA